MGVSLNEYGQPIGNVVDNWSIPDTPHQDIIAGHYCSLARLDAATHAAELFHAFGTDPSGQDWTYLPYGPFADEEQFHTWISEQSTKSDPLFFAVVDAQSRQAVGVASFLRIAPNAGTIEIGHIHFSPLLQGKAAATEALYLMIKSVFALGYRRCEWKCNALNDASRKAALRLGFTFEGVFRQAGVVKGRNRDTAWYSILDREWPALSLAFDTWLSPGNFSGKGEQRLRLSALTAKGQTGDPSNKGL